MSVERLWRNDAIAAEWKVQARAALALAAPPREVESGAHAFGKNVATGSIGHVGANDEASGYFVGIDVKRGVPVVYTHHSPHESGEPEREGTVYLGEHDRRDIAMLCVPAHPIALTLGSGGLETNRITAEQLKLVSAVCTSHNLPQPRLVGGSVPAGPSWLTVKLV